MTATPDRDLSRRRLFRSAAALAGTYPVARMARASTTDTDAEPGTFHVGAAKVSADPEQPYEDIYLGGYGSDRQLTHIRDTLYARAVAITGDHPRPDRGGGPGDVPGEGPADEQTVVVITLTAVGLFAAYDDEYGPHGCQAIRREVAAANGIPASNVFVQSDHSHAAPDTIGLWGGVPRDYMRQLHEAAVVAGVDAFESRQEVRLYASRVEGPPLDATYDRGAATFTDDNFRVLYAETPGGDRIATVANYNPHPTVLYSDNEGGASADWPAWAAQIAEDRAGGQGMGTIGAIGAMDWNKDRSATVDARETAARDRLRSLYDAALDDRRPVRGSVVDVDSRFFYEPLTSPAIIGLFAGTQVPGFPLGVHRSPEPPWFAGGAIGTFANSARIGDVFVGSAPGEMFPEAYARLYADDGVTGPQVHFFLGGTNDFLGYMTYDHDTQVQITRGGATYLAGCPERDVLAAADADTECNDHWTLQVSPTIGRNVTCHLARGGEEVGFENEIPPTECIETPTREEPPGDM